MVYLFKKRDEVDPGNDIRTMLRSTVGGWSCKMMNDRMGTVLNKVEKTARSKQGRVHTIVGKSIQGRKDGGLPTYFFCVDILKAHDCTEKWAVGYDIRNWDQRRREESWKRCQNVPKDLWC